ncbi:hypothetical protein [Streptomyces sp. NPDC004528]
MIREPDTVVVRPIPDPIPIVFDKPRCLYAAWPWLTDEFMRELEDG